MYTAKGAEALVSRLKSEGASKAKIIRQLVCLGGLATRCITETQTNEKDPDLYQ